MMLSFSELWQQAELSDVDVLLTAPPAGDLHVPPQKLAEFPGHIVLLSTSPYFKAQILRWQRKRPPGQAPARVSARKKLSASSSNTGKPGQVVLTLQDASEQSAAMAVLAALYGAKPLPELLSELSKVQQLQAAMLADMWELPAISTAAAGCLTDCLRSQGKLSEAVTEQVLRLQAVPDCLQPLCKQALLQVLGNLEQCWADPALSDKLLHLPLCSMELLLSCEELTVASEDTVLYTVQRYMDSHCRARRNKLSGDNYDDDGFEGYSREHIQKRLGPLLRCQHLSQYWLLLSAMSYGSYSMPMFQLERELKQLLTLRTLNPSATSAEMKGVVEYAPPSWFLGERSISPVSTVQLTWEFDVSTLRETAQRCAAEQEGRQLVSSGVTPPLGGMAFELTIVCEPVADRSSAASIGIYAGPSGLPPDASYSFSFEMCAPPAKVQTATFAPMPADKQGGFDDFFDVGPMEGGWDEAVWAAKGLPTAGCLVVKLSVSKVGHIENAPC